MHKVVKSGGHAMKKKSKRLLTFLLILLLIFAGLIAAFYEVFDVSAWQRLDKYKF